MKKSSSVAVTAVAAISMAIACGPGSRERQARVCVDRLNTVVPAALCQDTRRGGGLPYFWYYHASYASSGYPATGTVVTRGGRAVATKAAPVARGGFGSTASGRSAST